MLVDYIAEIGDGINWVYSKRLETWEKATTYLKDHASVFRTSKLKTHLHKHTANIIF